MLSILLFWRSFIHKWNLNNQNQSINCYYKTGLSYARKLQILKYRNLKSVLMDFFVTSTTIFLFDLWKTSLSLMQRTKQKRHLEFFFVEISFLKLFLPLADAAAYSFILNEVFSDKNLLQSVTCPQKLRNFIVFNYVL